MKMFRTLLTASALTAFTVTLSYAQSGLPEDLVEQLDEMFAAAQLDLRAPGLVYGVVDRDYMLRLRGYGVADLDSAAPVTADTAFRIASMTR